MTDLRSITQLLLRLTLGVVFFAHGWEKLVIKGIDKTAILFGDGPGGKNGFEIPFPTAAAHFAAWAEVLGGAALILGVLLPFVGGFFMIILKDPALAQRLGNTQKFFQGLLAVRIIIWIVSF